MIKKAFPLLILLLMLTGCASSSSPNEKEFVQLDMSADVGDQIISLADVNFKVVPEQTYYILLDESLSDDGSKFVRKFIKYDGSDGAEGAVEELDNEIELPYSFKSADDARNWLREFAPEELALYPKTYLSDSVLSHWEQEGYDYSVEAKNVAPLDSFKRMGAVTRISDPLLIEHDAQELIKKIERIEKDYLPDHANIDVTRDLEALSQSFNYRTQVRLFNEPGRSQLVSLLDIELTYRVDELGHPLELTLEASFENREEHITGRLLPVIDDLATFAWMMRDGLVEEFGIYGVGNNNSELNYANISLYYEGEETGTRYRETFSVR
ncbi:hypothetical protein [Dethiobacter alkaliphilus]|uniref:hypothetical protein n=1 Tax=Dethiobacter alkaliphilus TaxID=427926 RepID=UPI002226E08F|nr:hypothetical protein [Dethiobacter alkaliphilus]MCW3490580.1 hypothetical protein [Dethiobacter alkaliphilus]